MGCNCKGKKIVKAVAKTVSTTIKETTTTVSDIMTKIYGSKK